MQTALPEKMVDLIVQELDDRNIGMGLMHPASCNQLHNQTKT